MEGLYREGEHVVNLQKARALLEQNKVEYEEDPAFDAIDIGINLGILTLKYVFEANDYVHGPFETYMLKTNGIIVFQPNPMRSYVVYHVVEVGYTDTNE